MDLLFSEYASPYSLLDEVVQNCEFCEWIIFFIEKHNEKVNEKAMWELYLYKDWEEESFEQFKSRMSTSDDEQMNEAEKEEIISRSNDILNSYNPEQEGGA